MKFSTLFSIFVFLFSISGVATQADCRLYYGGRVLLPAGEVVRSALSEIGNAAVLLSNYESLVERISLKKGISTEVVELELAQIFSRNKWIEAAPGLKLKIEPMIEGSTMKVVHYLLEAGFEVDAHRHTGDELTVIVSGTFISGGVEYKTGDTIRREKGTDDPPGKAGKDGVLIYSVRMGPAVPIPTEVNP